VKLVYICSPYAGDIEANITFAKAACRYVMEEDCAPVAVHLLYPQILDDSIPAQRELGIRMGLRCWLPVMRCGYAARVSATA
jgi:hypothetical protein